MLKIGLAGGSGSGKGAVSLLLSYSGIPSFDCDAVYHDLISRDGSLSRELAAAFGDVILSPNRAVDRKKLAEIAFHDPEKRKTLNEITHKRIIKTLYEWIERAERQGVPAILIDAPLLFESGLDRECDLTLAVIAPPELRIERITARDDLTPEAAAERIAAQIPDGELVRRADYVVNNGGDRASLANEVNRILTIIKERGKTQ